jgi:hypothetical protein
MEFINISGTSRCNHIQRLGNLHAHTDLQAILILAAASWQLTSYFPPFTHDWAGTFGSSVTNGIPRAATPACLTRVKQIAAFTVDLPFRELFRRGIGGLSTLPAGDASGSCLHRDNCLAKIFKQIQNVVRREWRAA